MKRVLKVKGVDAFGRTYSYFKILPNNADNSNLLKDKNGQDKDSVQLDSRLDESVNLHGGITDSGDNIS